MFGQSSAPVVVAHNVYSLLDTKGKKKSSKKVWRAVGSAARAARTPAQPRSNDDARARAPRLSSRPADAAQRRAAQDALDKKSGSKKSSKKTVELDEKLWSQTQLSVASWADCDDEDASFDAPAPATDAGASRGSARRRPTLGRANAGLGR
jgi:hypothetical protein